MANFRIGYGYDAHRFAPREAGRRLVLGGVSIPYEYGLEGHSDADVLIHALCDALMGALALGDIGKHFPDTDAAYKNIDSTLLLARTAELVRAEGYEISNVDVTLRLQRPKVAPFIEAMRKRLAEVLKIKFDQVSVKATTTEKMGFEGSGEGASASAAALVYKL